jgi:hypothetical protein
MSQYKGTGNPTLYTTTARVTPLILAKDTVGRRLYNTMQELAAAMRVKEHRRGRAMEQDSDLVGVIVNLGLHRRRGQRWQVSMFDDFDIDYNQQKYLIETRISGALTRPKSAIALRMASAYVTRRPLRPSTPTPVF